ncbi:4Fe-4S dicluster domain-containing protein [Candidatus Bathyarchaeota archaeon]|nr:4Fe-4S dicluster domain-containing protein [Candidatus Bathyarchaeota archaeon]
MSKAVLVDIRKCIGCRACQVACKRWNDRKSEKTVLNATPGLEWTNPSDLSPRTYTYIRFIGRGSGDDFRWHFLKIQCNHCVEPGCASVCPTKALSKSVEGPVLYDVEKCIGCKYCISGCPFNVPRFDEEKHIIEKCTFCADRLAEGLKPACVAACPTGALSMHERNEVIQLAESARSNGAHIYGKDEVGGTSWVYVSDIPLTELGLPQHDSKNPTAYVTDMLLKVGLLGVVGAGALYGLGVYSKRRSRLEKTVHNNCGSTDKSTASPRKGEE